MTYRLRYDRRFMQMLEALPGDVRSIARRAIKELAREPRPPGAKELAAHPTHYRMWLPRDHRLVWQVIDHEHIVDLLYLGPKSDDLYERIGLGRGQ